MKNRLTSGEVLRTDEFLVAPDESCYLIMQGDGNLCLYAGKGPSARGYFLWGAIPQSRTKGDYFATMQADGNFVISHGIPGNGAAFVWSSGTRGDGGLFAATLEKFGTFTVASVKNASAALWGVRHLRVLTYNIHLIEDSAVATGAAIFGKKPVIFQDEARYNYMIGRIRTSGADIVAIQEVWSADNMERILRDLRGDYPFGHRGSNGSLATAGSGIVMVSKYPLSETSFYEFRGADDWEDKFATKGVIAATVNVSGANIRVATSHCWTDAGGPECHNIRDIVNHTRQGDRPMILMGDFNIHRKGDTSKFSRMETLMNEVGAQDSWRAVHGPDWNDACATDDQADNNLAQFFSPDRNTPDPDCIDYVYLRSTAEGSLRPVSAQVPRDWAIDPMNERPPWYWVHQGTVAGQPSAAAFGMKLCVVARSLSNTLQTALYDSTTRRWVHSTIRDAAGDVISASSPSIVWYANVLHLFFQRWGQVYKMESTDGVHWSAPNSQGDAFKSSGGVSVVLHGGTIVALVRDPGGRDGVFCLRWTNKWTTPERVGITTPHDIAAASHGNRLCVVTRDSNGSARGGLMRALLDEGGHWQCGQLARGATTSGSPGISANARGFDVFYREHDGGGIFHQSSGDGMNWSAFDFTGHATSDAVCAVSFNNTTMIFYAFVVKSGDHVVYSQRAMAHGLYPPAVRLDSSDHYPYQVDLILSH
jgi:endonuclease/exonuclease/phosphatase family metal-dependent hydrolase